MKNKTKVVRFRCTEDECDEIKKLGGLDVSAWILYTLLGKKPGGKTMRRALRKMEEASPLMPKVVDAISNMKCQSPYCASFSTEAYQRATGTFWLCDTHKP